MQYNKKKFIKEVKSKMVIMKMKSIREQVYEALKEKIINGEISSGERIVEVDYAKEFGVSRTPLREALRMLEFEGLVNSSENFVM